MSEDYCSYEVAKLLKEKGFDEPCRTYWDDQPVLDSRTLFWTVEPHKHCGREVSAPTHQMAMKWLREEKYVIIFVLPTKDDVGNFAYCYDIAEWNDDEGVYEMNRMSNTFYTYEQAVEAAIKYVLENLI